MKPLHDLVNGWPIFDWGPVAREGRNELWNDQGPGQRIYTRIIDAYRQHQRQEAGLE